MENNKDAISIDFEERQEQSNVPFSGIQGSDQEEEHRRRLEARHRILGSRLHPVYSGRSMLNLDEFFRENQVEKENWKYKLGNILESHQFHMFILFLVLLDFLAVMTELVISLFEECEEEGEHHEEPAVLQALTYVSIVILSIFIIEQVSKLVAFGPRYFFKHPLHSLDAIVVFVSLSLIITLKDQEGREVAGLLVVFRFWRFVRILDAVLITAVTKFEEKIEKLEAEIKDLKSRLHEE